MRAEAIFRNRDAGESWGERWPVYLPEDERLFILHGKLKFKVDKALADGGNFKCRFGNDVHVSFKDELTLEFNSSEAACELARSIIIDDRYGSTNFRPREVETVLLMRSDEICQGKTASAA